MLNVTENYKLIDLDIDGEQKTVQINTSEAWGVFECEGEDGIVTVNEMDRIEFITDSGEIKSGAVTKISGKNDKTKIQMMPTGSECEEIWSVGSIREKSLKILQ